MNTITKRNRPKFSTVLAVLALFLAIGGTATAANGLINGKKIKPGTVSAKQLKNKTITKSKLAPSTLDALKGAQGPKGEKGEKGIPGPQGVPGPKVVNTYSTSGNSGNVQANDKVTVASFNNLPSGNYMVIAKAVIFAQTGGNMLRCAIETNNQGGSDEAQWTAVGNITRTTVPMVLSTTAKVTQIKVNCNPGDTVGSFNVRMVAVPVA